MKDLTPNPLFRKPPFSRSEISAPNSRNKASMSPQRTLAETGRAWISSRVRWCLRFTILWYQKTIPDQNEQMKDLTPNPPTGRLSGEFFKLDPLR
ncbi:hypothetical protein [Thauera mechernichensis]